jgi:hypothetical protein
MLYFERVRVWHLGIIGAVSVLISIIAFSVGSVVTGSIFLLFGLTDLGFAFYRYYYIERHGNVDQSTATIGTTRVQHSLVTINVQ